MSHPLTILGPALFERSPTGAPLSRIGTIFLKTPGLVTAPGIHAMQRLMWIDHLNTRRTQAGLPPLTDLEAEEEMAQSVDLLFDETHVLIRPEPQNMPLALRGDELLQTLVSKRSIRYLNIQNTLVRDTLRKRGEAWRMSPIPREEAEIKTLIRTARTAIAGLPLYYYNTLTGTRFLTLGSFRRLQNKPLETIRAHLIEIARNAASKNRFANPEIDFFPKHCGMTPQDFQAHDFATLPEAPLRAAYTALLHKFDQLVPAPLKEERFGNMDWRKAMTSVLLPLQAEDGVITVLEGLSPEFFMQIAWLPGGRIEEGELMFDPIFEEADRDPHDQELQTLCDHRARGILLNYLREYSKVEYVNIGRTRRSLSKRTGQGPRAHVYIVELKETTQEKTFVKIIRFQRWTICTHLHAGKGLLDSILESEDYTDYVMDRRLGCRQIGMNLPEKMTPRRLREHYRSAIYPDFYSWATYFERDYINGRATDKIPPSSYASAPFSTAFAHLLGAAAACNIVLGRARLESGQTIFDDGDEVIIFDRFMMPIDLIVSEPTGSFSNYLRPFADDAHIYADAMNRRKHLMPNFNTAAETYLTAFENRFSRIQSDYRNRRRAFHALFRDRPYNRDGSVAYRWECLLNRLDTITPQDLTAMIRRQIHFDGATP